MNKVIEFNATVLRVRTMADGGKRLELDLPNDSTPHAAALMECQRFGVNLAIRVEVLEDAKKDRQDWKDPEWFKYGGP